MKKTKKRNPMEVLKEMTESLKQRPTQEQKDRLFDILEEQGVAERIDQDKTKVSRPPEQNT